LPRLTCGRGCLHMVPPDTLFCGRIGTCASAGCTPVGCNLGLCCALLQSLIGCSAGRAPISRLTCATRVSLQSPGYDLSLHSAVVSPVRMTRATHASIEHHGCVFSEGAGLQGERCVLKRRRQTESRCSPEIPYTLSPLAGVCCGNPNPQRCEGAKHMHMHVRPASAVAAAHFVRCGGRMSSHATHHSSTRW
jgi:hypothetical protein